MHRSKKLLTLVGLLAVGALATGCTENRSSIFVRQIPIPDPENGCGVSNDPEAPHLLDGYLDPLILGAGSPVGFTATLLVGNQLVNRGDPDTLRTETSRVNAYEAEVTIFGPGGGELSTTTQATAGFLDIGSAPDPGYGLVPVAMVPAGVAAGLPSGVPTRVVSRTVIYGVTLGGVEVESGSFDYPITVCPGCTTVFTNTCTEDFDAFCNPEWVAGAVDARNLSANACN